MSQSFGCKCPERKRPVKERNWEVWKLYCRCSAFDGYSIKSSEFSTVHCLSCGKAGRTKAAYVALLKPASDCMRGF